MKLLEGQTEGKVGEVGHGEVGVDRDGEEAGVG